MNFINFYDMSSNFTLIEVRPTVQENKINQGMNEIHDRRFKSSAYSLHSEYHILGTAQRDGGSGLL